MTIAYGNQTFYCYSLNRRKTAYTYAGLATRIACSLRLHKAQCVVDSALSEHRKRIWWTTFQMDSMTAMAVGLRPTLRYGHAEQSLPSDELLDEYWCPDFSDGQIISAQVKLCQIQIEVFEAAAKLQDGDFLSYQRVIEKPSKQLEKWRMELPSQYSFDFSQDMPPQLLVLPAARSLSSVYLRYHQVE